MTAHVLISGMVQGVGFRFFIRSRAKSLGLKGWVTNTPDGKVEAFFIGEEGKIEKILEDSKKGPMLAKVKNVEVSWDVQEAGDMKEFNVIS